MVYPHERGPDGGVVIVPYSFKRKKVGKTIITIINTIVIIDERRKNPKWKFPAGGIEKGETPEETASREIFEETGMRVPPRAFQRLFENNGQYCMIARVSDRRLRKHKERGSENEKVRIAELDRLETDPEFLDRHRTILYRIRTGLY